MSRLPFILAILLAGGCGAKNYNVADPVCGPPPPRIHDAVARQQAAEKNQKTVQAIETVSYEEKGPLSPTSVVAKVNGRPVLAGEVLEQYSAKLKEFDAQLAIGVSRGALDESTRQAKIRETQEMLIKRDLSHHIEQMLMADAVRGKLKKEQLEGVNVQLAEYFEKEVVSSLKKKFKVDSSAELEFILQQQGMSLETMRKMFTDQQLASQYLRTKMGEDPKPNRAELVAVYNSQLEDYFRPLQVKWQQLQINIPDPQHKAKAMKKLADAEAELGEGVSFDEVVKKYSDGPLRENGGHWDWTQPASVANQKVRKALEKLQSGQVSEALISGSSIQIVKVNDRREAGHQPLEEVQEDIRQQIIGEFRERRAQEVITSIREQAVVETIFDDEEDSQKTVTR